MIRLKEEDISKTWSSSKIVVSICCTSFNHEKYIEQALDGFLMQKTSFAFEIVIHDDASTDSSPAIIKKYQKRFPNIIRPLLQTKNQYSKGIKAINPNFNYERTKGKFIALCEGDDYWTDPLKLQKQVDFLNKNEDFIFTFHNTMDLSPNGDLNKKYNSDMKCTFTISDFSEYLYSRTLSIVFKKPKDFMPIFLKSVKIGDWPLTIYLLQYGKAKYFPDTMGVYRKHDQGLWNSSNSKFKTISKFETFVILRSYLKKEYKSLFNYKILKLSKHYTYYHIKSLNVYKSINGLFYYIKFKFVKHFFK